MKAEELEVFKTQQIKIFLKNKRFYTGKIIKISEDTIHFQDRYGLLILINLSDLSAVETGKESDSHGD